MERVARPRGEGVAGVVVEAIDLSVPGCWGGGAGSGSGPTAVRPAEGEAV